MFLGWIHLLDLQSSLIYIFLTVMLFSYFSFWYGTIRVFKKAEKRRNKDLTLFRFLSLLIWYYSLFEIFFFKNWVANSWLILAAIAFQLMSLSLFWITQRHIRQQSFSIIFNEDNPHTHVSSGPYKYVRHPFYSAYIFCYLGLILIFFQSPLALLCGLLIFYYVRAARLEEKKFLASSFASHYEKYQNKTGMFFPRIQVLRPTSFLSIFLLFVFSLTSKSAPNQCSHLLGTCDYYECVSQMKTCSTEAYFLEFARPNCQKFVDENFSFTEKGQEFLAGVRNCLQFKIEEDMPQISCDNASSKAQIHHVNCYLSNNYCSLPFIDKLTLLSLIYDSLWESSEFRHTGKLIRKACLKQN